jgi:hypothetical protein
MEIYIWQRVLKKFVVISAGVAKPAYRQAGW